jgi:ribonuclease Z
MSTSVILTGTGVPHPAPGRAGAGTLVRCGDVSLQFDAGRATVLRLVEAGVSPAHLTALFVTHVHSDHLVDLADVAMTRWILQQLHRTGPLRVVVPAGVAERFVHRMLDAFDDDIAVRMAHVNPAPPEVVVDPFEVPTVPTTVWRSDDGTVVVEAVAVHHEPVPDAVAYRVTTPDAAIVISGDTRVCDEVANLAAGCDLLVHEACRRTALADQIAGTVFETILSYHADTVEIGRMAQRIGVPHVLLTHLIPAPSPDSEHEAAFERDVRKGGYTGTVTVVRSRPTVTFGAPAAQ